MLCCRTAFAHELLWDWSHKAAIGGTTWFGHWRDTIARYDADIGLKSHWQHRLRDLFEQATLDFIQLQRIDYAAEFQCNCSSGVMADGITLGFHTSQLYLTAPWQPAKPADAEPDLTRGSLFAERTFVKSASMRKDLAAFADQGLSDERHTHLLDQIEQLPEDAYERLLLPFLVVADATGGVCKPAARNQQLVCILGTSAPACQLIKPCISLLCQRFIDEQPLSAAQHLELERHAPHLQRFLRHHIGATQQADAARALVECLMKVCAINSNFADSVI